MNSNNNNNNNYNGNNGNNKNTNENLNINQGDERKYLNNAQELEKDKNGNEIFTYDLVALISI